MLFVKGEDQIILAFLLISFFKVSLPILNQSFIQIFNFRSKHISNQRQQKLLQLERNITTKASLVPYLIF